MVSESKLFVLKITWTTIETNNNNNPTTQILKDFEKTIFLKLAPWTRSNFNLPFFLDKNRSRAAKNLQENYDIDVIISDDGLQHYAMGRDIEIAVIDGVRRLGNGFAFPAGPLREPKSRLNEVDFIINNGGPTEGCLLYTSPSPRD